MTLDPAPPVLGGDASRVRAIAEQQWRDRRALERQLHDGAALRISALVLRLGLLRHAMPGGQEFGAAVNDLQDELHLTLQELRDVAGRLYPPLLDEAGLGPALREVAARGPVPIRVDAPDERFGAAAEGAAYFALLRCLPPSTASADGSPNGRSDGVAPRGPVDVVVRRDGNVLVVVVTGVDSCHASAVHDGVRLLGGTVTVGGGAVSGGAVGGDAAAAPMTVRIPCA